MTEKASVLSEGWVKVRFVRLSGDRFLLKDSDGNDVVVSGEWLRATASEMGILLVDDENN